MKTNCLRIVAKIASRLFRVIMTFDAAAFKKIEDNDAQREHVVFFRANEARRVRELLSRVLESRFLVDESASFDRSFFSHDHETSARKTKQRDHDANDRLEIFDSHDIRLLFILASFDSQELRSLTTFFSKSFITIAFF